MTEPISVVVLQETVNDETVRIVEWFVNSGSSVECGQLICQVETSKALMDIHSPAAGRIEYECKIGEEVPVGSQICWVVTEPQASGEVPALTNCPSTETNVAVSAHGDQCPPARLTLLALKEAAVHGIEASSFARGSLVRRADVLRRVGTPPPEVEEGPAPIDQTKGCGQECSPGVPGIPLNWINLPRRKIFERKVLTRGRSNTIQSSVSCTCHASRLGAHAEWLGLPTTGFTAIIVFEVARLLNKYSVFNATYDNERMGVYSEINIGWAIDGGNGLVTPVIRQADKKGIREIAEYMQQQLEQYVENELTPADLGGGTFTISNLAGEGITYFQPLISQGQSAILGVGCDIASGREPALYLTLAFDHQVCEGRTAAKFVRELSQRLESHTAVISVTEDASQSFEVQKYCIRCQRDSIELLAYRAVLLKSVSPPGAICSLCVAGL
jgi:pyruvate/2-oxoglutarate dehydrogenase complex dihydrolipoamide acyltransferase (E2) component